MSILKTNADKRWQRVKVGFQLTVSAVVIVLALMFFIYPAIVVGTLVFDSRLHQTGENRLVPGWFQSASGRYLAWANTYLETNYAQSCASDDIPATEWPIFGSVFFLVAAEDLQRDGKIDATRGTVREAVEKAAEIVASPVTATWVRNKWGDRYLDQENVFYRMLLIMGLASYERITGEGRYHAMMSAQRMALAEELAKAKLHLRDDYANECYPADMLWAVAAIQRAARLDNASDATLAKGLMAAFDGRLKTTEGLPAFQADSRSGLILQGARGCANSGILLFAAELDPVIAGRWYDAYEANFWKDNGWIVGWTEMPRDLHSDFMDVDSGPVVFEFGSVATAFGIGAAKSAGRFDHAAPMTMEAMACSWPTPLGPLVPGFMGRVAAGSWSLGEVALLFSMTRPTLSAQTVPFTGHAPWLVWILLVGYSSVGAFFIAFEIRCCRRLLRTRPGGVLKINHQSGNTL